MLRSASVHGQIRRHKFRPGLELMEVRLTPSTLVVDVTSTIDSNAPNSGSLRAGNLRLQRFQSDLRWTGDRNQDAR